MDGNYVLNNTVKQTMGLIFQAGYEPILEWIILERLQEKFGMNKNLVLLQTV